MDALHHDAIESGNAIVEALLDDKLHGRRASRMFRRTSATRWMACGRIELILDWATARGYRSGENPAPWRGHIDELLPGRAKIAKVKHHAALPYAELPIP